LRVEFALCGLGLGHAGRCIPIAKGLQNRDGNTEVFFTTYKDALSYLRLAGLPTLEVPAIDFQVKPDGTVDFRRTAFNPGPFVASFSFLKQIAREIEIMKALKPDVLVSDSRASAIVAAKMLGIQTLCILNQFQVVIPRRTHYLRLAKFTDAMSLAILGKIWTSSTEVLIPDFPPPATISSANLRMPENFRKKTRFIGPILPVHSEELPDKTTILRKYDLDPDRQLIFAPISGPMKEKAYLMHILTKIFSSLPEDYQIVMTLGRPGSESKPVQNGNLTIFNWTPNRFEYLKASDIVISRAGHGTLMQTICYNKPAILIPTPSHTEQINNAKRGEELGVAMVIDQEKLTKENLHNMVEKIIQERDGFFKNKVLKQLTEFDGLKEAIEATERVALKIKG
jgi:UDP:flavonoid glycosyltransferase YjiC (YdhE family)